MVYIKSDSNQTLLLSTNLRDIIDKDHICFLIEEVVSQVDTKDFDEKVEGPGNPTYHPRINLKIILNGVCDRITSSRKLEKQTKENIVFRYLSENLSPNFHTIAMFRKENHDLIKKCFLQTVEIAKKLNMVNLNKLYLDGMKVKANASKSKTFTKEEIDFLSEFVDKQFEETDKNDNEEDKEYGNSNGEIKIPEHLTHKRKLQEKVKEMLKDIGKAKEKIDKAKEKIHQDGVDQVNLTDMDSKMMKMKKGIHYEQAYNCQLLIEDKSEIIVGNHISDSPTDIWETEPTMEKFKQDQKVSLKDVEVFQDNGYSCSATAEYYEKEEAIAYIPDSVTTKELHGKAYEITKFDSDNFQLDFEKNQAICPAGHRMDFARKQIDKPTGNWTNVYKTRKCKDCEFKKECVRKTYAYRYIEINPLMRKIRLRFKTKEGVEKYNKRFHKGEIAQAHIEHNLGYREFKCRENKICENEVNLFSTAYNLVKIYKKWKECGGKLNLSLLKFLFLRKLLNFKINHDTACANSPL
jgi:transposase